MEEDLEEANLLGADGVVIEVAEEDRISATATDDLGC